LNFKVRYKHSKKKAFWNNIQTILKKETRRNHKRLDRVVNKECKGRIKYLEECGTSEEDCEDTLNALVDEWISIQKEKEEIDKEFNSMTKDTKRG
jgi:hypothetical protein